MELKAIAREDLQSLGLVLKNELNLEYNGNANAIADLYCANVGRVNNETGEKQSFFNIDKNNGNTKQLDIALQLKSIISKNRNVVDFVTGERTNFTYYYIPYDIKESTKNIPTYTECHIGNEYVMNGYYVAKYEVLFSCDEATLRLVFENSSVNIPMIEFMNDIEDCIQAVIDGERDDDNPFNNLIKDCEDWYEIQMYDETGDYINIEFDRPNDLTSMIVSIRQIACDFIYNND